DQDEAERDQSVNAALRDAADQDLQDLQGPCLLSVLRWSALPATGGTYRLSTGMIVQNRRRRTHRGNPQSTDHVGCGPGGDQDACLVGQRHLRRSDPTAEPGDLRRGVEPFAEPLAEEIDAQVDRSHPRKAMHDLLGGLVAVLVGNRAHQREPGSGVEHRRRHAAVQATIEEVADQLGAHVEAHPWLERVERLDHEAQDPVERDSVLENVPQRLFELALLRSGTRRVRVAGGWHHRPLKAGGRRCRNAATPSAKSSVRPACVCSAASISSWAGRSCAKLSLSACLMSAYARVGWAARWAASLRASGSNCSSSSTFQISPKRSAVAASMRSASIAMARARTSPA